MIFKSIDDKNLVIRSLLLLTNGNIVLATHAIEKSETLDEAIRFIFCQKGQEKFCDKD